MTPEEWKALDEHIDAWLRSRSWFCESCKVEVYERRCPHCGKTKRERV